jgi:predicted DNA-binding protein (MmcQ/YjbR family)
LAGAPRGLTLRVVDEADVLALCLALPGAWPDAPWGDRTVAKVGARPGRVFAFPGDESVALKGRPEDLLELRGAYADTVLDAPYLSKKHWVRVVLDGRVPDDELRQLVRTSYDLVVARLPRAQRP